jgi:glyoxylase-like metal-dependent hydrolase (beta-lactamase superfamily II)
VQILHNVFRMSGPPYGTHENVYVVKGSDSLVMIDTGIDEAELALVDENIAYWGLGGLPLSHVFITHAHYDHCANAHILRDRGARIVAGEGDADGIERGDDRTAAYAFADRAPFVPCPVDTRVAEGDTIRAAGLAFDVIHVPGYTAGSVFYKLVADGRTVLFTGDVVKVEFHKHGFALGAKLGWSGGVDYDRRTYLETLERISQMHADILLPGHLQPCLEEGWQILRDAYAAARYRWLNQPVCDLDVSDLKR